MRRNVPSLSPANAACRAQVLAEIGRRLRDEYSAEPLPGRLVNLMKTIDQLPERHFGQVGRFRRPK